MGSVTCSACEPYSGGGGSTERISHWPAASRDGPVGELLLRDAEVADPLADHELLVDVGDVDGDGEHVRWVGLAVAVGFCSEPRLD
jgi:hypothetical protein